VPRARGRIATVQMAFSSARLSEKVSDYSL
jgi:hypothetical protein